MNKDLLYKELQFKAVRSQGPGGQHVNKVSSKIILFFDIDQSLVLDEQQKELLRCKLSTRISKQNVLQVVCDQSRSQLKNKQLAFLKFVELLESIFVVNKKRISTKLPYSKIQKRKDAKIKLSNKKELRKKLL